MKNKKNTKSFQKKEIIKLKRKLLKLWSEACREKSNYTCIYCGAKRGEPSKANPNSIIKIDAHHLLQKEIKDTPLKYEIKNCAVLCSSCHKYNGEHSAHKSPIVFYDWFRNQYPENYNFVLNNSKIRINLDNINVLKEIESRLINKESLDLELLKKLDEEFKNNPEKNLFNE